MRLTSPRFRLKNRKVQLLITRNRADLGGGGGQAAAVPALSSSDIFFLSKYTMFLSFCKQAVGTFYFFS